MVSFKQEFQFKYLKFGYRPVQDFVTSPWFPVPVLIAYRAVFAIYSISWAIYKIVSYGNFRALFTLSHMTNWAYMIFIIYYLLSASITILHYNRRKQGQERTLVDDEKERVRDERDECDKRDDRDERDDETKWYHKLQWFFYNMSASLAIGVTLFYWTLEYDGKGISFSDINVHFLNSVFMLLDHTLSSMPVRLLHMVYPMLFVFIYAIATVLYWAFVTKVPIYTLMDYSKNPGLAIGLLLTAMLITAPGIHLFLYAIFSLREFLAANCNRENEEKVEKLEGR